MKKCVLICEDDEGIIDVARIVLEEKGYNVKAYTDGTDIFTKVKSCNPSVILLDLWMPEISGDQIARQLKNNPVTKSIPIVIVSASKDIAKTAKMINVNNFLSKPFDISDLENIVEKYAPISST